MRFLTIIFLSMMLFVGTSCSEDKPNGKKPRTAKADPSSYNRTNADAEKSEEAPAEEVRTVPPEQLKKAKEILAAATEDQIAGVDAKGKYKMFCAACHGFDGALGVNGAKDLSASKLSLVESVAQVYFGKGLMTPFRGLLKDHEIVAVSKYIEKEIRK